MTNNTASAAGAGAQLAVRYLLMQGGNKIGVYVLADDLCADPRLRDLTLHSIIELLGTQHADKLEVELPRVNRVALIRASSRPGIDVDYLSGEVNAGQASIDYSRSCANLLAGVAPFAIERGLVAISGDVTPVRIFMEGTGHVAVVQVPTCGAAVQYAEAPTSDAPHSVTALFIQFLQLAGSTCGALFPTGNAVDVIDGVAATCIDNGAPMVILRAKDVGCTGLETPQALSTNEVLRDRLEHIRMHAGLAMRLSEQDRKTLPRVCLLAASARGSPIVTRTFTANKWHPGISILGAATVAAACVLKGTIAVGRADLEDGDRRPIAIEYATGTYTIYISVQGGQIGDCGIARTVRWLFNGEVLVPIDQPAQRASTRTP
ncbi:4-oxalomesaconate tautomerase [Pseudomonas sp. CM25]|uniref:PrpF domain-containing protein n=1 Tax=Pseudomonas sp. CM25 TaxID=2738448 RepID=UPI0015542925|nr:PrpF domain-containing protein [Pseudomonas sp. CM25]NQD54282.1 4-oxalomesaconate tautomerase [Pseudomonas sp. CM25]